MLYRSRVINALEERRERFLDFDRALRDEVGEAAEALRALAGLSAAEVKARAGAASSRVTYPSEELERVGSVVAPFRETWRSHEEARRWAASQLAGRVTFAADGSQIFPGRETSVPVAAVQVASFENRHTPDGRYSKDVHFEVITPDELTAGERDYESPDQIVGLRRFELEARTICDFIERHRGWRENGSRAPVAFLDGTLLISSRRKDAEVLFFKHYAEALVRLILLSRDAEVPVVGYVDHSYAPDLRDLLEALNSARQGSKLYDAQLLRAPATADDGPLLSRWGDRTVFFHCQRPSLAESFFDELGAPLVGFVYLQTTSDGHPARLELPAWVYERGLLEEVLDAVRAECVVGNGYPYAIETADEAAVMTARDRAQFLRTMQDFAEAHRFDFRISRKAASKGRRR
jgi:hypothetical protein